MTRLTLEGLAQDRDDTIAAALRNARGTGRPDLLAEIVLHVAALVVGGLAQVAAELRAIRAEITALRAIDGVERAAAAKSTTPAPGSALTQAVLSLVDASPVGLVEGNAAEFLERLEAVAPEPRGRLWPSGPRSLSVALRRLAPALRAAGVEAAQGMGAARRTWSLRRIASGAAADGTDADPGSDRAEGDGVEVGS